MRIPYKHINAEEEGLVVGLEEVIEAANGEREGFLEVEKVLLGPCRAGLRPALL